jgi:hypothetical protein
MIKRSDPARGGDIVPRRRAVRECAIWLGRRRVAKEMGARICSARR